MSREFNSDWLRNYQMKTAKQHNAELVGEAEVITDPLAPLKSQLDYPAKRVRQSTKPLMNKLETEFYERIRNLYPNFPPVRCQAKRFKLGNGIWYRPDFTASQWPAPTGPAVETAWEVKGPHAFRGGLENLKVAAGLYPEICWLLVWKDSTGQWNEQRILP
jgi:hypothetical protein